MKITTDVNFAGSRPAGSVMTRASAGGRTAESDRRFAAEFSAKLQRDRAMADALAIAQSSRQIVQKAIDASSRLRAIAFEAMTTGKVNMDELNVEISGIQGVLAVQGETVSVPVDRSSPATIRTGENLAAGIQKLNAYAGDLQAGEKVDPALFSTLEADLMPVMEELDERITAISSQFSGIRISSGSTDYVKLNSSTAGLISGNPSVSMNAQGNLNTELAGILATA